MPNQESSKWASLLRSNMNLKDLGTSREVPKTFHKGGDFTARGTSKRNSE